jgi:hypothetical protein
MLRINYRSELPENYTGFVNFRGLGFIEHYNNGILHREDGPAYEDDEGNKQWYFNGKLHRVNGPASELLDRDEWYINGKLHRVNGPAIEYHDESSHLNEWFLNDKEYSQEEWFEMLSEENKLEMIWNLR